MKNGTYLGRSAINEFRNREFMDFAVPEWDGTVRIRRMDVRDRLALADSVKREEHDLMFMCRVVSLTVCDHNGQRVYKDEQIDDLLGLDLDPIRAIYKASMEFSKLRSADLEQAEKNSATSTSADSPSA